MDSIKYLYHLPLLATFAILANTGCNAEEEVTTEVATFFNTVPGHEDTFVTKTYEGFSYNYFHSAVERMDDDRFLVAWIDGKEDQDLLLYDRYDVSVGGFVSGAGNLDSTVINVRRAGSTYAVEGGTGQRSAWVVWDYHPNPSLFTVCRGRIRYDGTLDLDWDLDNDAAGAAGAKGWRGPKDRVLIVYVQGNVGRYAGTSWLECGDYLKGILYDAKGNVVTGPFNIFSASGGDCVSGPQVVWNKHATRFEVLYQHRLHPTDEVWWKATYVTNRGTPGTTTTLEDYCAFPLKGTSEGVRFGLECHRHTLAYDDNPARNGTSRFLMGYYSELYWYDQNWNRVLEVSYVPTLVDIVDVALPSVDYSYQSFEQGSLDFRNPKYYDTDTTRYDSDDIGYHSCSSPIYTRGECFINEAMATSMSGEYTAVLYADQYATPYDYLYITILDAS